MARDRFSSKYPRAPYKVIQGKEDRGTYITRAEARRRQQQLESEQFGGASQPECWIQDRDGDVAS